MAAKKKLEDEERARREAEDRAEVANDRCNLCATYVKDFSYMIMMPAPMFWTECPNCGNIFVPESLRKKKLSIGRSSILMPN